jgi:GTP-binding protein EngB required for normal cell division
MAYLTQGVKPRQVFVTKNDASDYNGYTLFEIFFLQNSNLGPAAILNTFTGFKERG